MFAIAGFCEHMQYFSHACILNFKLYKWRKTLGGLPCISGTNGQKSFIKDIVLNPSANNPYQITIVLHQALLSFSETK
jgi:hypothetical protein